MKIPAKIQQQVKYLALLYYFIRTPFDIRMRAQQIRKSQNRKLKKIIKIAYETELYRPKFDAAGITPADIQTIDDLVKIPVLTKTEYRDYIERQMNEAPEKYKGWVTAVTSGSTGTLLELRFTPSEHAVMHAKAFRAYRHNGFHFIRQSLLSLTHNMKPTHSFIKRLGLFRMHKATSLDEPAALVEKLNRIKPDVLSANLSNIVVMMKHAEDHQVALFKPRLVVVISEVLTPRIYEMMKEHFGDCIVDRYGCIETGLLAYTLKGDISKYNFINQYNAFIVLDDQLQPSDKGDIYITSLFQKGFPLINYQLGDTVETRVEKGERIITKINGRSNDWIKYSDGTVLSFLHLEDVMHCSQFRVIQEDYENLTYVLVRRPGTKLSNREIEEELLKTLQKNLPEKGLRYHFQWVDEIPVEKNGKIRTLISKVP